MFSRTIRKSLLDTWISVSALPPTFLLPSRARFLSSTTPIVDAPADGFSATQTPTSSPKKTVPTPPAPPATPPAVSDSIKTLLPLLASQPNHYITAHIHARPYLVTEGDSVRLPFHMPGVVPGDVLRLNRASNIGSRDYTLKGTPYLDERLFECRATVMGVEAEPMRLKEKTKRRNRKTKTVRSKHKYTILKISDLKIKNVEDITA